MIKLTVNYEEKDDVKALGAKWNTTEKYWYITNDLDFTKFEKWIPKDIFQKLQIPVTCEFKNIFYNISQNISMPSQLYSVTGDVLEIYDKPDNDFIIYTMIDNHNLHQTLRIYVSKTLDSSTDMIDKRIKVTGTLEIYKPYASFQIKAHSIEILGNCSRITQIKEWAKICKSFITNDKPELPIEFDSIGIIAKKDTRGYDDFINHLKPIVSKNCQIHLINVNMTKEEIIKAIEYFNDETDCQYICIVRGGGNPESLLEYSHPDLFRAICHSEIPIITGIAHDKDVLLCDLAATYNAGTPTGAAEKLNERAGTKRKIAAEIAAMNQVNTTRKTWRDMYNELEQENIELYDRIDELEKELHKYKNKGLISRIFNW